MKTNRIQELAVGRWGSQRATLSCPPQQPWALPSPAALCAGVSLPAKLVGIMEDRSGGFEEAGTLEEAGPQMHAFPTRLACQMSSSSVVARVGGKTEGTGMLLWLSWNILRGET